MRVWEYDLQLKDTQEVEIPKGSQLLTVIVRDAIPRLCVLADPNCFEGTKRVIHIVDIGDVPKNSDYLATFRPEPGGHGISHVFVEPECK